MDFGYAFVLKTTKITRLIVIVGSIILTIIFLTSLKGKKKHWNKWNYFNAKVLYVKFCTETAKRKTRKRTENRKRLDNRKSGQTWVSNPRPNDAEYH